VSYVEESYDIVVVGAGHAGCEAALASARLGFETILFTISMDSVALMPCNPNIGGSSKGHIVREIDALGGEMGRNIDKTYIQSKMLNRSKGPAVHSLRAQADKGEYTKEMRRTLQRESHLTLRQAEVTELIIESGDVRQDVSSEALHSLPEDSPHPDRKGGTLRVAGVRTASGAIYHAKAVVLCTGVYMEARCIYGDVIQYTGPNGLARAVGLSRDMEKAGIKIRRFKTGTPPRIDKKSIDFSVMQEQKGDEDITPFSFENSPAGIAREQISCWLTYTNEETHQIIRENIDRSPLYSGVIEGVGPRYCPSIEDKIMKFPDKDRHQLFVEPEGEFTDEMYLDGMPSSLPEDVQYRMVHSVPGLEKAKIVRNAYAIEYDCIFATELKPSLEFKQVAGLFSAGQLNGSSGYEEAAGQGLMAGINAARLLQEKPPVVLRRSDAYIGVLIDDLVTKETREPYRMMTSRAEYRLLLRQDNADMRLTELGHEIGLVSEERYARFVLKRDRVESEIRRLSETPIGASKEIQSFLTSHGSAPLVTGSNLAELIRRPEFTYRDLEEIDPERPDWAKRGADSQPDEQESEKNMDTATGNRALSDDDWFLWEIENQINISIKYEGYIERQKQQVEHALKAEEKRIPPDIDYMEIKNLRKEARQKLMEVRPESIGQASRISGVSPADITMLMLYLRY